MNKEYRIIKENQLNKYIKYINLGDPIAVLGSVDSVLGSVDLWRGNCCWWFGHIYSSLSNRIKRTLR